MSLGEYKKLLIPYPENGEDPFTYDKGDKAYFLWLTNRTENCSLLGNEEILDMPRKCYSGEIELRQFNMGYTNLCQFERLFLLHLGETAYEESKGFTGELQYCKEGIGEEEPVADFLLFAYKDSNGIGIKGNTWKCTRERIKELTGKETYSIADARKVIEDIRSHNEHVFACVGVKTIENISWH